MTIRLTRCGGIEVALAYMRKHLGEWVSQERLMDVSEARDVMRSLRGKRQDGYPIEFSGKGEARLVAGQMGVPRGDGKSITGALRAAILERDGGRCQLCGIAAGETAADGRPARMEIDHIVPRDEGGGTTETNLRVLCHVDNHDRQALMLAQRRTKEPSLW